MSIRIDFFPYFRWASDLIFNPGGEWPGISFALGDAPSYRALRQRARAPRAFAHSLKIALFKFLIQGLGSFQSD
jgi:hypothetical protein